MNPKTWLKRSVYFLCVLYVSVLAQERVMPGQNPRLFNLDKFSGSLNLQFQLTGEKNYTDDILQYDVFRRFLQGGIRLSTAGSVYHPNLLSFWADVNIVGNRIKDRLISDESVHNSLNNTYNIRALFFKKKKFNIEFFALSHYITAERRFRGRFFSRNKSAGLNLNLRTRTLPFTLSVSSNRNTVDSLTYSERDEKSENIDFRINFLRGPHSNSYLTFKNKNYSESVYDVDYDSLELLFNFRHHYGAGSMNNITSTLSYNRMKGNYNFQLLRYIANSQYFFREDLDLRTIYTLTRDEAYDRSLNRHELSASLTHRLFESLMSTFLVGGRIEDTEAQERNVLFGGVTFNYRKKIRGGNIGLYISQRYEDSVNKSGGDVQHEIETFEFSFSDTITLIRPGINTGSIQITDLEYSRIYIRGVDYEVNIVNNSVHITRLPGGDIPENGLVAVHYAFLSYPDYRLKSHFQQINASVQFLRYFEVFYRDTLNNHDISSDFITPLFDSFDRRIVGARFNINFFKTEYAREKYDSVYSDYNADHFRASAAVNLFKRLQLSGSFSLSRLTYESADLYNNFNTYSANLTYSPNPKFNARAIYRMIGYETSEYSRNRESLIFKIRWEFRKISLEAFYEHILDGYRQDERLHDFFSITLSRRFGN